MREVASTYRQVSRTLLTDRSMGPAEKLVLLVLADLAKANEHVFCGLKWLEQETGLSATYLRKVLRCLREQGLVEIEHRNRLSREDRDVLPNELQVGSTNVYTLSSQGRMLTQCVQKDETPTSAEGRGARPYRDAGHVPIGTRGTSAEGRGARPYRDGIVKQVKKTIIEDQSRTLELATLAGADDAPDPAPAGSPLQIEIEKKYAAACRGVAHYVARNRTSTEKEVEMVFEGSGSGRGDAEANATDADVRASGGSTDDPVKEAIERNRRAKLERLQGTIAQSKARTEETKAKKVARKAAKAAAKPKVDFEPYAEDERGPTPRGHLRGVWFEEFAKNGFARPPLLGPKDWGQLQTLLDRLEGDLDRAETVLRYVVSNWAKLRDRFSSKNSKGASLVPGFGFAVALLSTLDPEAQVWAKHAKTIDEYNAFGSEYEPRPRDLEDRYAEALRELKSLGIM